VDLQSHLLNHTGTEVFSVKANQKAYWRLTSLDIYKDGEWMSNNSYTSVRHKLPGARSAAQSGVRVEQDYTINNLDSPWLPAAYEPDRIDGVGGISYDPQSGSLITSKNTSSGLQYHVSSMLDVGQLNPAILTKVPAPSASDSTINRYLQLPTIPNDVVALSQRVTAGKSTEYDKALALQNYLRSPLFTYDEGYDLHGDGPNALSYFLFRSHKGYCQQFAGSFGVMARALGLPTRLAIGWTWGNQDSAGVWHVTDDDTHTWPEVYFPQVGWVAFEPTPSRGMPGAQAYTGVPAQQQGTPAGASATTPTTKPSTNPVPAPTPKRNPNTDRSAANGGHSAAHHHTAWWRGPVIALGTLALLAAAWLVGVRYLGFLRVSRRRARVIHASAAGDPMSAGPDSAERREAARAALAARPGWWSRLIAWLRGRAVLQPTGGSPTDEGVLARAEVLMAWAETGDLLAWWGVRRRPNETYTEFADRAVAELRTPLSLDHDAGHSLAVLARAATKADYSRAGLSAEEGSAATAHAATIRHALIESATAWQRARRIIDPRVAAGP
jgi:transglutaminase-like putative cysteine protease